jgi:osmoprotectant transport system substrate-binding protein
MTKFRAAVGLVALAVLTLTGCGGSSNPVGTGAAPSGSATSGSGGTTSVVVGSGNFSESVLLAEIYAAALRTKGIGVTEKLNIGSREVYMPALQDGSIDLVPEYSGVLLQHFDKTSTATTSKDVYAALPAVLPSGLKVLQQSAAEDKDAIVVSKATADTYKLASIADLAPVAGQLVMGGPPEFTKRADGLPGLKAKYGVVFKQFKPLDVGGPLTVNALKNGQVQAADIFSTDPSITANGFVVLADPKFNFAAQNVLPLINATKATPQVTAALDAVSAKLDTTTLTGLVAQVVTAKKEPADVAKSWLTTAGLS